MDDYTIFSGACKQNLFSPMLFSFSHKSFPCFFIKCTKQDRRKAILLSGGLGNGSGRRMLYMPRLIFLKDLIQLQFLHFVHFSHQAVVILQLLLRKMPVDTLRIVVFDLE